MTRPGINGIAPFFIVRNTAAAVAFYREKLGFEVIYQLPEPDSFFAIVSRGGAMLMVKEVEVDPAPNSAPILPRDGMHTSMSPILMRWRTSSRRVESSLLCR